MFINKPTILTFVVTGGVVIFPFEFKFYANTDINVYHTVEGVDYNDADDILDPSDYTIDANVSNIGGSVTITKVVADGDVVTIARSIPAIRIAEYAKRGSFTAKVVNDDQDYQSYVIQDLVAISNLSIRSPISGGGISDEPIVFPSPFAQAYIRWDLTGTFLENDTTVPDAVGESAQSASEAEQSAIESAQSASEAEQSAQSVIDKLHTVNTASDLLTTDFTVHPNVSVKSYETKDDGRGGLFDYDPDYDKSLANGVKVFDPDQTLANQGNGVGNGCWRMQHDNVKGNIYPNPYSIADVTGRQILIGGVIRRSTIATDPSVVDANNWFFINNTAHLPLNIDMTKGDNPNTAQGGCELTADDIGLIVYYRGLRLHTFNVTADETMSKKGVRIGNSGGNTFSILYFFADCTFIADLTTLAISGFDSTLWPSTRFSVVVADTGYITLRHPIIDGATKIAKIRYKPRSSVGSHFIPIFESSESGDNVSNCFLMGTMKGTFLGNADGLGGIITASECVDESEYVITWNSATSVLRVEHPVLMGNEAPDVQLTSLTSSATSSTYIYTILNYNHDYFEVIIKNADGTPRTSLQYTKFAFTRGLSSKVSKAKMDGTIHVELPDAEIYASEIDSHNGNFWISGTMQD